MDNLVKRLERNSGWRNERWQCVTDPALLTEAAARIEALEAALAEAEGRVKAITIAMHDAIRRPMGVVPETAEPFYQPALASDPLLDRQGE